MEGETMSTETQAAAGICVTAAMALVLFIQVGLSTIIKAPITKGKSNFIFMIYSNALAFCFLLPPSFFYYRKRSLPPMSTSIVCRILILSMLGCCVHTSMYAGIGYSSPTMALASQNQIPVFTFIFAVASRMEKLDLKLQSFQAKCIGTMVSIIGVFAVALFNGLPISNTELDGSSLSNQSNWMLGASLILFGNVGLSLLFIVQTCIMKDYAEELMVTTTSCIFVVVISIIGALIAYPNPKAWVLKSDMEIVTILYSAIFMTSIPNMVNMWACHRKGPVYAAIFNPLGVVFAVCLGVIFLEDSLNLGSLIGAMMIIIGFFAVIWGQAQVEKICQGEK